MRIVHPIEIGRNQYVGGRAALELLGERRTRSVGDADFVAAFLLIVRDRLAESVLEARCGEYQDLIGYRWLRGA